MYLQVHQAQEVTIFPGHSKAGVLVIIFFQESFYWRETIDWEKTNLP